MRAPLADLTLPLARGDVTGLDHRECFHGLWHREVSEAGREQEVRGCLEMESDEPCGDPVDPVDPARRCVCVCQCVVVHNHVIGSSCDSVASWVTVGVHACIRFSCVTDRKTERL